MKETNVCELERAGRPAEAGPGGVDVTTTFGSPRTGGEQCEPECSGDPKVVAKINSPPPDPEVFEKATRRRFSAKYKLRILAEIDACTKKGQTGAILRREGLYSSNVTKWREQRACGTLAALAPKKRGRKAHPVNPMAKRLAEVERENERLKKKLRKAETIIDFQKKLSEMLGILPSDPLSDENS
jgi:transposase